MSEDRGDDARDGDDVRDGDDAGTGEATGGADTVEPGEDAESASDADTASDGDSAPDADTASDADTDDIVRSIGKSGVVVFTGMFLELGIAFFAKLIVAQQLTQSSYGEVTVGLTFLTVTGIIARLGFDTGIPRNAPRYEGADKRGVFVSSLILNVAVAVALAVILFAAAAPIATAFGNRQLEPVLRVIALGVPGIPLMRVSVSGTQAVGRSAPRVLVQNITHPVARIALIVAVVLMGATPVTVAAAYVVSNWIGALAGLYFLVRQTPILDRSTGWTPMFREMVTFSLPLMVTTGMGFVLANTDTLMLQYFVGSAEVGVYDIGYTIANMLTIALGSLSFLFLPNISELHADEKWEEITHIYKLVTKWVVFLTVPPFLLVLYFPEVIIGNSFGAKYTGAAPYLMILGTGHFLLVATGPNQRTLSAIGDTTYIMYVNGFAAGLNVLLNLVLIAEFGTIGAAVASTSALVTVHVLYSYRVYTEYGISPYSSSLVGPLAVFLPVSALIYLGVVRTVGQPSLLQLAGLVAVGGLVYGVCILSLSGLQEDDVMLVKSAEESLGIDLEPVKRVARGFL